MLVFGLSQRADGFYIIVLIHWFRYDGQVEDELSLLPGDILKPLGELEPGWWAGLIGQ